MSERADHAAHPGDVANEQPSNVVPLRVPPRRRPGTPGDPAAAAVASGAERAGGERTRRRRRVTPLLEDAERARQAAPAEPPPAPKVDDLASEATEFAENLVAEATDTPAPGELESAIASILDFLSRRVSGDYEVDEFGFDAELTETVLIAALRPLYRKWFRVEVRGLENVPSQGGALVVANHSGTIAMDALMLHVALFDEHPAHRHMRLLGADLVFSTPVIGDLARKIGSTLATNADAERLLNEGQIVGVFPEGFKGIGKPFTERYKLQRFGRGGFVSAAMRTSTPIVPCAIVGAEEIYPMLGNSSTLARLLNVPYFPITPTFPQLGLLGLLPLPSKWLIEFGEPIATDELGPTGAEDPMLVFDVTDQVRETIQQTLYSLLMQRRSVFH